MVLDIILLTPLLIGLIRGLFKGLISEVMAILAIIFGCMGARLWAPMMASWLLAKCAWAPAVCNVIAYILVFVAIAVVIGLIGRMLSHLFKAVHLGGINRLLGGLFGLLTWGIVLMVLVFCVGQLNSQFQFLPSDLVAESKLYPLLYDFSLQIWNNFAH